MGHQNNPSVRCFSSTSVKIQKSIVAPLVKKICQPEVYTQTHRNVSSQLQADGDIHNREILFDHKHSGPGITPYTPSIRWTTEDPQREPENVWAAFNLLLLIS